MGIVQDLLLNIPLPKLVKVQQQFDETHLEEPLLILRQELNKESVRQVVKPGMSIAVAVGSRGVQRIDTITAEVVRFLKNTLSLKEIEVSKALLPEVLKHPMLRVLTDPYDMEFDESGNLRYGYPSRAWLSLNSEL